MNKTIEYAFLKLRMLNATQINCQLVRKVCILKDHIYDLKLPERFGFDIIRMDRFTYYKFYRKTSIIIDEAIHKLFSNICWNKNIK